MEAVKSDGDNGGGGEVESTDGDGMDAGGNGGVENWWMDDGDGVNLRWSGEWT